MRRKTMLSNCANTGCSKPFLRLSEGKLFLVETDLGGQPGEAAPPPFLRARPKRRGERYWLCDRFATEWTLIFSRGQGIQLAPAPRPVARVSFAPKRAVSGVSLGQVFPGARRQSRLRD